MLAHVLYTEVMIKKPTFIVGLGNPGSEYAKTRHNAGWLAIDSIAEKLRDQGVELKTVTKSSFHAEVLIAKEKKLYLIKPETFMNDSGKAVAAILKFYSKEKMGSDREDLVVIHDDLDLELGEFKLQFGRGPKVHNGLLSLYQHLGTKKFWHLRLGIDSRDGSREMPGSSYVLQRFAEDELTALETVVDRAVTNVF